MGTKGACGAEDAYLSGRGEQVKIDEERYVDVRCGSAINFLQQRYDQPSRKRAVRRYEVKHTGRLELKVGHGASSHWYRYRGRLLGRTSHVVLRLDELEEQAHGEAADASPVPAMVQITLKESARMSILEVGKEDPDTQFILQLPAAAAGSKRDYKTFRVTDSPDHLAAWKEVIRAQCCFDSKLPRWKDVHARLDSPDQLLNQFVRVQTAGRCAPHPDEHAGSEAEAEPKIAELARQLRDPASTLPSLPHQGELNCEWVGTLSTAWPRVIVTVVSDGSIDVPAREWPGSTALPALRIPQAGYTVGLPKSPRKGRPWCLRISLRDQTAGVTKLILDAGTKRGHDEWLSVLSQRFPEGVLSGDPELGQVVEFKRPFLASSIFVPHKVKFSSSGVKAILLRRDDNGGAAFKVAHNPTSVELQFEQVSSVGGGAREICCCWHIQQEQFKPAPHIWQIEIRMPLSDVTWQKVDMQEISASHESLFDLGSLYDLEKVPPLGEWRWGSDDPLYGVEVDGDYGADLARTATRRTPGSEWKANEWHGIIRGLTPNSKYEIRVRSAIDVRGRQGPSSELVFGAWSAVRGFTTATVGPSRILRGMCECGRSGPPIDSRGSLSHLHDDSGSWLMAEPQQTVRFDPDKELHQRWIRVRQAPDWIHGMDVLFLCSDVLRDVSYQHFEEAPKQSDSKDRRLICDAPEGYFVRSTVQPGHILRVSCSPRERSFTPEREINYAYMAVRRTDVRCPQASPLSGRFVRIDHPSKALSCVQIRVFDREGQRIKTYSAAMSSSYCSSQTLKKTPCTVAFNAKRMIDATVETFAATHNVGGSWLRVDLGRVQEIGRLDVLGRLDSGELTDGVHKHGFADAKFSITTDRSGQERVWECAPELSPQQRSLNFVFDEVAASVDDAEDGHRSVPQHSGDGNGAAHESFSGDQFYPLADYKELEKVRTSLVGQDGNVQSGYKQWKKLGGNGVQMPFCDDSAEIKRAESVCVVKQFSSFAKPYWLKIKSQDGSEVDVVMKDGDDLRQDQLVLTMIQLFNQLWLDNGVMHTTSEEVRVPVAAPVYRVIAAGTDKGFVEMLPNSKPVDDIKAAKKLCDNEWRPHNDMVPSSVACFVIQYVLNIGDRHTGNMVVTGGTKLANIDFGWLEDHPPIDAGSFPIPEGLQYLLSSTEMWAEFHDLLWDSIQVLRDNEPAIRTLWKQTLKELQFNDRRMSTEVPEFILERLSITRERLDVELRSWKFMTAFKNFVHWVKVGGKTTAPDPLPSTSGSQSPEPASDEPHPEPQPEPQPDTPAPPLEKHTSDSMQQLTTSKATHFLTEANHMLRQGLIKEEDYDKLKDKALVNWMMEMNG
eukprot:SAG25_NODE_270_length_10627_cov_13.114267_4_plen_1341_part_00